jgi:hypothetical protein
MLKLKIFYSVLLVALMLSACSDKDEDSTAPGTQEVVTETQKTVTETQKSTTETEKSTTESQKTVPATRKIVPGTQEHNFLESVKLVELAGRTLQGGGMKSQAEIDKALKKMDKGLQLAFQVEGNFLKSLDARLGKNYQRYFVKGIETYRLGIEAGIQSDQLAGLQLLGQWAEFWSAEKKTIQAKLKSG